jgi:hypothetical protein
MNITSRVRELQEYIAQGKIIEAMHEFYDTGTRMQENAGPPTVGLAANIEREKRFLSQVKAWKGYTVKSVATGDGVSTVESVLEFVNTREEPVRIEQVAVQRWKDGKIVDERFYYDTGAK